jgi:hypothetical protein
MAAMIFFGIVSLLTFLAVVIQDVAIPSILF